MFEISSSALPIAGIRLGAVAAGIRKPGRIDTVVIEIAPGANAGAVFTKNVFCAAPVELARRHLGRCMPRLLVINSGNANAGTGEQGYRDALDVCAAAAAALGCEADAVLPFSTGVIGQRLPAERMVAALPAALGALAADRWAEAAQGIMTTDTVPKRASVAMTIAGTRCHVTGIAKGAGMIKPNMATMLGFIATDASVEASALQTLTRELADRSFNRITIDGDTSTNDSCVLIATGSAGGPALDASHPDWPAFVAGVEHVFKSLARAIVRDGEGATKLVSVQVRGGDHEADCLHVAYAVAESPLVKTALFAADPNWGRILAAVGRSGVSGLRIAAIDIEIGGVPIVARGEPVPGYDEAAVAAVMQGAEYEIAIRIGDGPASTEVLTCDFSFDYVKINAEYRS
jgi:glutamate N-acetyltransferase/amino-acid N-acetyltransferase